MVPSAFSKMTLGARARPAMPMRLMVCRFHGGITTGVRHLFCFWVPQAWFAAAATLPLDRA